MTPNSAEIHESLAQCYYHNAIYVSKSNDNQLINLQNAIKCYETAISIDDECADYHFGLSEVLFQKVKILKFIF